MGHLPTRVILVDMFDPRFKSLAHYCHPQTATDAVPASPSILSNSALLDPVHDPHRLKNEQLEIEKSSPQQACAGPALRDSGEGNVVFQQSQSRNLRDGYQQEGKRWQTKGKGRGSLGSQTGCRTVEKRHMVSQRRESHRNRRTGIALSRCMRRELSHRVSLKSSRSKMYVGRSMETR